jgi:hypothetical protein
MRPRLSPSVAAVLASLAALATSATASAQSTSSSSGSSASSSSPSSMMSPTGGQGQLNIDQLGGYRIGTFGGLSYAGILGFATQRFAYDVPGGTISDHYTTFWFAPAADYFFIEHLSIGALLEVSSTSGSRDRPINNNITVTDKIPAATDFTIMPRVGYMFAFGDRLGIWPRLGIGYASRQVPIAVGTQNPETQTYSSVLIDVDVVGMFRLNESFYLSLTPQLVWGPGGSNSTFDNAGKELSSGGSFLQFGAVLGFGVLLDL